MGEVVMFALKIGLKMKNESEMDVDGHIFELIKRNAVTSELK